MYELINQLKILFFGSLEQWNNYGVGTTLVEGQDTTNRLEFFVKYSPHLVALILTLFFFFILIYVAYRLLRKITK